MLSSFFKLKTPKTPQDIALECIQKMDDTRSVRKIIIEYAEGDPVIINQNTTQSDSDLYPGYKSLEEAKITTSLNDKDNIIYYYLKEVKSTDPLNPVSKPEIAPLGLFIKTVDASVGTSNGPDDPPEKNPAKVIFEFKTYTLKPDETILEWFNTNKKNIFINVGDEYVRISSQVQFYRNVDKTMYSGDSKQELGVYKGNNKDPKLPISVDEDLELRQWVIPYSKIPLKLGERFRSRPVLGMIDKDEFDYRFETIPIYVKNSTYQKMGGKKSHKSRKNRRKLRKTR